MNDFSEIVNAINNLSPNVLSQYIFGLLSPTLALATLLFLYIEHKFLHYESINISVSENRDKDDPDLHYLSILISNIHRPPVSLSTLIFRFEGLDDLAIDIWCPPLMDNQYIQSHYGRFEYEEFKNNESGYRLRFDCKQHKTPFEYVLKHTKNNISLLREVAVKTLLEREYKINKREVEKIKREIDKHRGKAVWNEAYERLEMECKEMYDKLLLEKAGFHLSSLIEFSYSDKTPLHEALAVSNGIGAIEKDSELICCGTACRIGKGKRLLILLGDAQLETHVKKLKDIFVKDGTDFYYVESGGAQQCPTKNVNLFEVVRNPEYNY